MIYYFDNEVDILTICLRESIRDGEIADRQEFAGGLVAEYGEHSETGGLTSPMIGTAKKGGGR